jgi:thiamine kinase-like enzyme/tetratricopeptide (TPR) repeat protein
MGPVSDENLEIILALARGLEDSDQTPDIPALFNRIGVDLASQVSELIARASGAREQDEDVTGFGKDIALAALIAPDDDQVRSITDNLMPDDAQADDLIGLFSVYLEANADVEACRNLGTALRQAGREDEACVAFIRALAAHPSDADSLNNIAALLRDRNHYAAALKMIAHLINLHPSDPWAHVQQGNVLARMEQPDAAIAAYGEALALDSKLKGVQTALARQRVLLNDLAGAEAAFAEAISIDPKDRRALVGMAELQSKNGRHAESLAWYRRALARRPRSNSLKRQLANALLLREHWQAGRALMRDADNDKTRATWTGEILAERNLVFADQPGSSEIDTLFGIGLARCLAETGQAVICVCPESLVALITEGPPELTVLNSENQSVSALLDGEDFGAFAPLSEIVHLYQSPTYPLSAWMTPSGHKVAAQIANIAFISGKAPAKSWPKLDDIRAFVVENYDTRAVYMEARPTVGKIISVLKTIDLVVTDDPLSAATAAAIGRPSIFLLPADCDWWWGDRGSASPWGINQTLIRLTPNSTREEIFSQISKAVESSGFQDLAAAPLRPSIESQDLAEMLDRVAPLLQPMASGVVEATVLTGGSRNAVYRLHCDDGDKVLRLERFPPPRQGFYAKEIINMEIASAAGLAPRIDYTNVLDGSMMLEFIDGETMSSRSIRVADNAVLIGHIFSRLHQLPGFRDRFDIFKKIERNTRRLKRAEIDAFTKQQTFNDLVTRLIKILKKHQVPHCATHNDPLTRNFIRRGDDMMLIDWECSGIGDPHWEVAAMSSQVGLDDDVWQAYLNAYFGREDHPGRCRVTLFEALCRYYWWSDALSVGISAPDDPSWLKKAEKWRGWFTETVTGEKFSQAVNTAENYQWDPSHAMVSANEISSN